MNNVAIFQLYLALVVVNHDIVGFQIPMHDAFGVAKIQRLIRCCQNTMSMVLCCSRLIPVHYRKHWKHYL